MAARAEWEDSRKWQALPERGGDSGSILHVYVAAVANLTPPSAVHVPWHVHVHAGVAVPGTLLNLQHSPAPSRVRNPHAMRLIESWRGCGPRAWARWFLLGYGCASLLPLCTLVLRKQQRCWLVYRSTVFLWCLVACEMHACRCVAVCRSGGLGSGRKPVVSVCVKRASSSWGSMPRFRPVLR